MPYLVGQAVAHVSTHLIISAWRAAKVGGRAGATPLAAATGATAVAAAWARTDLLELERLLELGRAA